MSRTLRTAVVVVAAGSGVRFGGLKQFAPLAGKPLLQRTLEAFRPLEKTALVAALPAVALESPEWRAIADALGEPVLAVAGGRTRAESVLMAVEAAGECDLVAVHDGARPFPPLGAVSRCIELLGEGWDWDGAIVAAKATDTLKRVGGDGRTIVGTVDRSVTVRAETPQVCRQAAILDALRQPGAMAFTDEAQALESLDLRVAAVTHNEFNLKVTTRQDLRLAEAWLASGGLAAED